MKRFIFAILALSLLLCLVGCSNNDVRVPVFFYYCTDPVDYNSSTGVISAEIRDRDGYGDDLVSILNLYLQGPESDAFRTPFSDDINTVSLLTNDSIAEVILNQQFSNLTGQDLTLACACISMTVMDLTNSETVRISSENAQLDGNDFIEMSRSDLLFLDTYTSEN